MNENNKRGYSIRKSKLMKFLSKHNFTIFDIATRIGISEREMEERLDDWDYWSVEEIEEIVNFVGAKAAYEIIYFPTRKERYQVKKKVFRRNRWAKRKG